MIILEHFRMCQGFSCLIEFIKSTYYVEKINTSLIFTDPDDPEYIRQMRRPAEVKEDLRQMDTRQRVSTTLGAAQFRDELEEIVKETLTQNPSPANMLALQQITELLVPQSRFNQTSYANKRESCV